MENRERLERYNIAINEINRQVIVGKYSSDSIRIILKQHKLSLAAFTFMTRTGLFTQIKRGRYVSNFKIIEPFQTRKVLELMDEYQKIYQKNYFVKHNKKQQLKENYNYKSNNNINEDQAIKFLKGLGYKIMKPIQQFEEI